MEGLEPSERSLLLKVGILLVIIAFIELESFESAYHSLYTPHKEVTV